MKYTNLQTQIINFLDDNDGATVGDTLNALNALEGTKLIDFHKDWCGLLNAGEVRIISRDENGFAIYHLPA